MTHGLFIAYRTELLVDDTLFPSTYIKRSAESISCHIKQITTPKFHNDKLLTNNGQYIFTLEGVILNSQELLTKYHCATLSELLPTLYTEMGESFFQILRGSFCGAFYDKTKDLLVVFNDQIGDHLIFYNTQALPDGGYIFFSDLRLLAEVINTKQALTYNTSFILQLLTYGYSPICNTVYSSIQRIAPGQYIRIEQGQCTQIVYHRFNNYPNHFSEKENIAELDRLFQQAVKRALDKNETYGYTNYLPLSAGLDSRMTCCVAKKMTNKPLHYITYSQTNYYDELIPKQIAQYWHNPIHFTPLDGGNYLQQLDKVVRMTQGLVQYSGAAQVLFSMESILCNDNVGIVLTGMLGDIIINTCYTLNDPTQRYKIGDGACVPKHIYKLKDALPKDFLTIYPNRELYYIYVRGFQCANLGSPIIQQFFGGSYSPFYDVDFLTFVYSIPLKMRWNYGIYDKWILQYYPDMAQWLHNGRYKIGKRPQKITICGRLLEISEIPKRILWKLLKELHIYDFYREKKGTSMNPEDDWMKNNPALHQFITDYISQNIHLLDSFPFIRDMAQKMTQGTAIEKILLLTILSTLRQYPLSFKKESL